MYYLNNSIWHEKKKICVGTLGGQQMPLYPTGVNNKVYEQVNSQIYESKIKTKFDALKINN